MIKVALKQILRERGMSQRELARRIGKHPDVVSKFAREATGGVSYELLDLICAELDCDPGEILRCEPGDTQQIALFPEEAGSELLQGISESSRAPGRPGMVAPEKTLRPQAPAGSE